MTRVTLLAPIVQLPSILRLITRRSWHFVFAAAVFAFGDSAACRSATAAVVELYPFAHHVLYSLLSILKLRSRLKGRSLGCVVEVLLFVKLA